jgi:hypothetical protein
MPKRSLILSKTITSQFKETLGEVEENEKAESVEKEI